MTITTLIINNSHHKNDERIIHYVSELDRERLSNLNNIHLNKAAEKRSLSPSNNTELDD